MANGMYVMRSADGFYELRQDRYRAALAKGKENKNDVCAVASTVEQMRGMTDKYFPDADYAAVEVPASNRPGDQAAEYAAETGMSYSQALIACNMD